MTIYFTADTHFGHARIIELCGRPFADVDEMNQTIIDNFNEQLNDDDWTYFLGDVVMGKFAENIELISLIKGHKIILPGNHDKHSRAYQRKGDIPAKIAEAKKLYEPYFDHVFLDAPARQGNAHYVFLGDLKPFAMSHYPFKGDHGDEDRFPELRPAQFGPWPLLHGHVHEMWKHNGRMFNVGVDVNDFRLVSDSEILEWANTL